VRGGLRRRRARAGTQQVSYPRRGLREARGATVAHRGGAGAPELASSRYCQPRDTAAGRLPGRLRPRFRAEHGEERYRQRS